ncbi:MAG TPA: OsmC family peroxiredoxin [Candidatus Acidoferrales bacterium]|nr:OsmC family peroxiredoxin [Candidatus Acidoferrales bacterium]
MPVRKARASWAPSEQGGGGNIRTESGAVAAEYTRGSRFASDPGTNPEELLGAAHAACFNMALAGALTAAGHPPARLETAAEVTIEKLSEGFRITTIHLVTAGEVPGIADEVFQEHAHLTKLSCPVSKALAGTDIFLEAKLV